MDHLKLSDFLDAIVPERSHEVRSMEQYAVSSKQEIIGPAAGQLLYLLAKLTKAEVVFEMDPGFGYSTTWLAKAMKEHGHGLVHHCVPSEDHSMKAQQHLVVLGLQSFVRYHVGSPVEALREIDGRLDMIFMDNDPADYPRAIPIIRDRLRPGGMLVANKILLGGKVLEQRDVSPNTESVRNFVRLITKDPGWICSIVPLHDGILIAQKR